MSDDDNDVEMLETFDTGEKFSGTGNQVSHERNIPLALRVRSGYFEENGLNLEGAQVAFQDIEYIALGIIHHSVGKMDPPKGMMRQMVGKMMGKNERADAKDSRYQESVFLDLYSSQHDAPFRLDAASINYRGFLGKDALYISQHNFYRLLIRIARVAKAAYLSDNACAYINRRREMVKTYGAIYDYEMECQTDLGRLQFLHTTAEMDLTRDSYVTEDEQIE